MFNKNKVFLYIRFLNITLFSIGLLFFVPVSHAFTWKIHSFSPTSIHSGCQERLKINGVFKKKQGKFRVHYGTGSGSGIPLTVQSWSTSSINVTIPNTIAPGNYWLAIFNKKGKLKTKSNAFLSAKKLPCISSLGLKKKTTKLDSFSLNNPAHTPSFTIPGTIKPLRKSNYKNKPATDIDIDIDRHFSNDLKLKKEQFTDIEKGCDSKVCIKSLNVIAHGTWAEFSVKTSIPASMVIQAKEGAFFFVPQGVPQLNNPDSTAFTFMQHTSFNLQLLKLLPNRNYSFLITATDKNGNVTTKKGSFSTLKRNVKFIIDRVDMIDNGNNGLSRDSEFHFIFIVNEQNKLDFFTSVSNGKSRDIGKHFNINTFPKRSPSPNIKIKVRKINNTTPMLSTYYTKNINPSFNTNGLDEEVIKGYTTLISDGNFSLRINGSYHIFYVK